MNKEYEEIFESDISEADKIAKAFHMIIGSIETHTHNEIELPENNRVKNASHASHSGPHNKCNGNGAIHINTH